MICRAYDLIDFVEIKLSQSTPDNQRPALPNAAATITASDKGQTAIRRLLSFWSINDEWSHWSKRNSIEGHYAGACFETISCKIVAIQVCRVWVEKVKLHFYWKLFQSLFPPVWLWDSPNITEAVAIVNNSSNTESSHCHQIWTWQLLLQWSLCMCNTAVWVCAKLSGNFPDENNGQDQKEC